MPFLHRNSLIIKGVAATMLSGSIGTVGWHFFYSPSSVRTEDAYVTADFTLVAPKISGLIEEVLVEDNQAVNAGDTLVRIDDRDFKLAVDQAQAQIAAASATVADKQASLVSQTSVIDSAKANIAIAEATAMFADQDNARYSQLAERGTGTIQNAQQAASRIAGAKAAILRDKAALETAIRRVDILEAELSGARAALEHAQASCRQAELNLTYTVVRAPIAGFVGRRSVRPGSYVTLGSSLLAVVPTSQSYIVANFQENQLERMRLRQPVAITVDAYPGRKLRGHVESLAPATDVVFAPIQPDNATGNFTKIVQRVPVKIRIDEPEQATGILRVGMSVITTVDVSTQGE